LRPALILIALENDITVSFISTKLHLKEATDLILIPNRQNGLKKESILKLSKIATISKALVIGQLGELTQNDMNLVNKNLMILFQIR
jgi:mRNA interferase MazF